MKYGVGTRRGGDHKLRKRAHGMRRVRRVGFAFGLAYLSLGAVWMYVIAWIVVVISA